MSSAHQNVPWLDAAEQRAWWALLEVGSGLFDALSSDLKAIANLTLDDYEVLHLLSQAEDHRLRVGVLADQMLASRTQLSQRLDRLAERDLVNRVKCPEDRRAINVVLSDAGFELLEQVAPDHLRSVRSQVFDHLTPTDVKSIAVGLEKVAQHLHDQRKA